MSRPGMTAGAVARHLGVAVTTLRTWHQRYGLGPTGHEPGQHRRYTAEDVARLELMQRLVADGVPPGEAARWADRLPTDRPGEADPRFPADPGAPVPDDRSTAGTGRGRRDGGGLALGDADPRARGVARAALRLDAAAVRERLVATLADLGVVETWDRVIRPVLAAIGRRHAASGGFIEVEHVVSRCASAALAGVPRPPRTVPARCLLACTDEEQHSLPIEALDAALAERGVASRMLGARVPPAALLAAVRRTGPAGVLLWSQCHATADPSQLTALLRGYGRPALIAVAGPGWDPAALPSEVVRPQSLRDAADLVGKLA